MWEVLFARSTKLPVIGPTVDETEVAIGATQHLVCIVVILAVVLPEANSTNLERPRSLSVL